MYIHVCACGVYAYIRMAYMRIYVWHIPYHMQPSCSHQSSPSNIIGGCKAPQRAAIHIIAAHFCIDHPGSDEQARVMHKHTFQYALRQAAMVHVYSTFLWMYTFRWMYTFLWMSTSATQYLWWLQTCTNACTLCCGSWMLVPETGWRYILAMASM
jgi:hypothetical protein